MRRRRFEHLRGVIDSLREPVRILDVGGTHGYWVGMWGEELPPGIALTIANLMPPTIVGESPARVTFTTSDACALTEFGDQSFDLVFSNSVIEHVGDRAQQQRMADAVRRVGRAYVVQTPNRWFPIEPHFLMPGFQFLPAGVRASLVQRKARGWEPQIADRAAALAHVQGIQLLSARDMQRLFPDAQLRRERIGGLTKSLTVVGGVPG